MREIKEIPEEQRQPIKEIVVKIKEVANKNKVLIEFALEHGQKFDALLRQNMQKLGNIIDIGT